MSFYSLDPSEQGPYTIYYIWLYLKDIIEASLAQPPPPTTPLSYIIELLKMLDKFSSRSTYILDLFDFFGVVKYVPL